MSQPIRTPTQTEVCSEVLQYLARGTTPFQSIRTAPSISESSNIRIHDLEVALSILQDASSPGPDPLAQSALGWSYGMGEGGGMGDWNGCHYMPGAIGETLRLLEEEVRYTLSVGGIRVIHDRWDQSNNITSLLNDMSSMKYVTEATPKSATRFCTVGDLPPGTLPYETGGLPWAPPMAGVCVPSSCGAQDLYDVFGWTDVREMLWHMANDDSHLGDSNQYRNNDGEFHALSRRKRYISSLIQSFAAGRSARMGIVCEGESGLPEIDAGFRGKGYYCTVGLVCCLFVFVLLGTLSAGWSSTSSSQSTMASNYHDGEEKKHDEEAEVFDYNEHGYSISKTISPLTYGSSEHHTLNIQQLQHQQQQQENMQNTFTRKSRFFTKQICQYSSEDNKSGASNLRVDNNNSKGEHIKHLEEEDYRHVTQSPTESVPFLLVKQEQNGFHQKSTKAVLGFDDFAADTMQWVQSIFGYFNAGLSFYEITRMKREDHKVDAVHKEVLQTSGESSMVNSYNSTPYPCRTYHGDGNNNEGGCNGEISGNGSINRFEDDETEKDFLRELSGYALNSSNESRSQNYKHAKTQSTSSSKCLNGMRSISMLWIILGHVTVIKSSIGFSNPEAFLPPAGMMSSRLGMFILSSRFSVDTFFFISGYLVMSGLLKRLDTTLDSDERDEGMRLRRRKESGIDIDDNVASWKSHILSIPEDILCRFKVISPDHYVAGSYINRLDKQRETVSATEINKTTNIKSLSSPPAKSMKWVIPFLFHRIMRILPTYGFVLLIWWKLGVTLGEGPFWLRWATLVANCDSYAWTNVLFVNNLVPWFQPYGESDECMYHTWYLGIDFQLCAILTPLSISLYLRGGTETGRWRWRKITLVLEAIAVLGIIVTSLLCSLHYDWSGHLFDGALTVSFDRRFYINPFFRASPYIIGFISAQLWHEKCRLCPNLGLTSAASTLLSILAITLMLFLTFFGTSAYDKRPCTVWENMHVSECGSGWNTRQLAAYDSLTRPAWGLGLAIISLLSFNGQLNFLGASSLLTWSGWDPIGKLSFSMYLTHPLVINVWFFSQSSKFRCSLVGFIYEYSAIVVLTFLASLVIGILVEWPMKKITNDLEKWMWSRGQTNA